MSWISRLLRRRELLADVAAPTAGQADENAPPVLTWPCHFCRDVRPDEFVGTRSRVNVLPHGVELQEDRRYCVDRAGCGALADLWAVEP